MSAGIAHEINNPLNFIYGGVHGLKDEIGRIGDDETHNKINPYVRIIDDGVKRATDIVKSLSHFSRQTASNEETCDLHQIINNCLSILNSSLKDKVEIQKNFTKQNRPIQGNAGKLHQVFVNLISNAEQAIGERGTIKISTEMTEKRAKVSIEDDGSGISEDNLSKIMDPFFTTKAPGVGTGLGLSITKKIINEHHGKLKVTSKLNQGTIFVVELPITPTT
jgi:signal transduction histidine kinase